jgi:hypothetical protein
MSAKVFFNLARRVPGRANGETNRKREVFRGSGAFRGADGREPTVSTAVQRAPFQDSQRGLFE